MIQNIIALVIVFSAVGYTVFSIAKNLTAKKTTKCGGCTDCSFHEPTKTEPATIEANNYNSSTLMLLKHRR
jgi:hypothetical protein